jgi:hypothetical protein
MGNLPTHTHTSLFSGATDPRTFTLVCFHGQPAQVEKRKSGLIVMSDLPRWKDDLIVMGDLPR